MLFITIHGESLLWSLGNGASRTRFSAAISALKFLMECASPASGYLAILKLFTFSTVQAGSRDRSALFHTSLTVAFRVFRQEILSWKTIRGSTPVNRKGPNL
jgi:hypothetical protein